MSLNKRHGLVGAFAAMLLLGTLTVGTALADEPTVIANTENTSYHFNLGGNYSSTAATGGRFKENSTSLFVWPDAISFDMCRIYGEGAYDLNSAWADGSYLTVGGFGNVYRSDAGVPLSLMTYINELHYPYARLTAWQCSQSGWMTGVWSPDSTRVYTYCNNGYH